MKYFLILLAACVVEPRKIKLDDSPALEQSRMMLAMFMDEIRVTRSIIQMLYNRNWNDESDIDQLMIYVSRVESDYQLAHGRLTALLYSLNK